MQDFVYKHKKKIAIIAGIILAVIIAVGIYFGVVDRMKSATIDITVVPSIAKVKIGNQEFGTMGEYRIYPGEYEVEISAEGFVTKTGKLVAVADDTVAVSLFLEPTAENSDWYEKHPEDALALGDIRSNQKLLEFEALKEKNTILNYIPYYTYKYTVLYEECEEAKESLCVLIDAGFGFRDFAVEFLRSTGEDLSRYYVKLLDSETAFSRSDLNVSDELEFDTSADDEANDASVVFGVVEDFASGHLRSGYAIDSTGVKVFGNFAVAKVSVTIGSDVVDTYRMIIGKVDGKWQAITNLDFVLSKIDNPEISAEVLGIANAQ